MRTYYYSLLFYYAKINFVSKHQKNHCICKVLFTSKIQIKHVIICYKNLYTAYLLNRFVSVCNLSKVWKSLCLGIQIYFKCVFDIWNISVWLCSGPCQWGLYVGTETSFILGFATDLCVVFGPCHKDNVAVVTKAV